MAYSTKANEFDTMEWHFHFPEKGLHIVSSAEAFFGLILLRMSNIQYTRLSHDRLDYLQIIYISQTVRRWDNTTRTE